MPSLAKRNTPTLPVSVQGSGVSTGSVGADVQVDPASVWGEHNTAEALGLQHLHQPPSPLLERQMKHVATIPVSLLDRSDLELQIFL